jgi:hypothetical protein
MSGTAVSALVILVFALVFAILEAWKGSATIRPSNFGWLALALLILVQIFYRGTEVFFK